MYCIYYCTSKILDHYNSPHSNSCLGVGPQAPSTVFYTYILHLPKINTGILFVLDEWRSQEQQKYKQYKLFSSSPLIVLHNVLYVLLYYSII